MTTKINQPLTKAELEGMYDDLSRFQLTYATTPALTKACKVIKGALLGPIFALGQVESIPKTKEK